MVSSPKTGAKAPNTGANDDTHQWTAAEVAVLMKTACSARSGTALLFEDRDLVPVGMAPGPTKVINWAVRYLDKDHRRAVYMLASAETWRRNGISVRAFIREMGWKDYSTYYRQNKRGLGQIAEGLKRDRIPFFTL